MGENYARGLCGDGDIRDGDEDKVMGMEWDGDRKLSSCSSLFCAPCRKQNVRPITPSSG